MRGESPSKFIMTNTKLKILVCSEASFLNTGFANYTKELLQRLYDSNKFEIAEFASYGLTDDPRRGSIKWKYYANAVSSNDPRYTEYNKTTENQFGRWRFEKVLLDFRPNVVIDVRDYWMNYYQSISPLRDFYHWVVMPTVDSYPQQEPWIETYASADAVFTYSDWGAKVLAYQSNNHINYINTVSPGVDINLFQSFDDTKRQQLKTEYGLSDTFLIGSVMRNQKRKLIPELIVSFKKLINELNISNHAKKDKCFLWLHTSYPDAGWDIPSLLKENNIFSKILFSYFCKQCHHVKASVFSGATIKCPKCSSRSMSMPSVTDAPTSAKLSEIYNLFDLYIQYAICEGFGMPQVEGAACGTPIATVDYSAMKDIVKKLEADPIRVRKKFKELETKAFRVYPDNAQLLQIIHKYLNYTDNEMIQIRRRTRELVEKHFDWDDIYKKWEHYLSSLNPDNCAKKQWDSPPLYLEPIPQNIMEQNIDKSHNLNTLTLVCSKYLKDLKFLCNMNTLDMLFYADYGFTQQGITLEKYSITNALAAIQNKINNHNMAERARAQNSPINEDFIVGANNP
jgi:glycosyltransferase involved in cell wall biosynthesis